MLNVEWLPPKVVHISGVIFCSTANNNAQAHSSNLIGSYNFVVVRKSLPLRFVVSDRAQPFAPRDLVVSIVVEGYFRLQFTLLILEYGGYFR